MSRWKNISRQRVLAPGLRLPCDAWSSGTIVSANGLLQRSFHLGTTGLLQWRVERRDAEGAENGMPEMSKKWEMGEGCPLSSAD